MIVDGWRKAIPGDSSYCGCRFIDSLKSGFRNAWHFAERRSGLMGSVSRFLAIDCIACCTTSLPLKPLRSMDQNVHFFENRFSCVLI